MQKSILALMFGFAFCANLLSQPIYFSVKFPDDYELIGCGVMPDTSNGPIITYYSNCNFNVGISVKDQVFNLNAT